jgi:hypothetical protein
MISNDRRSGATTEPKSTESQVPEPSERRGGIGDSRQEKSFVVRTHRSLVVSGGKVLVREPPKKVATQARRDKAGQRGAFAGRP